MAIDTRTKRQNVAQVGAPLPVSKLPSGSINGAGRAQIGWTYGGIAIAAPTVNTQQQLMLLGIGS